MKYSQKDDRRCTKKSKAFDIGKWLWKQRHATVALALSISLVVILSTPVLAWLYYQRSLQTVTRINAPNALIIGAGNAYDIRELELSNIDVTIEQKYKDVVFCVYSVNPFPYHLQLSHTTNIDFQYTIYPATRVTTESNVTEEITTVTYLDDVYSFRLDTPLDGGYLNQVQDSDPARAEPAGSYHNKTYAKSPGSTEHYDNVQFQAEPLYWKTDSPLSFPSNKVNGHYINYYVLRISWKTGMENNKETDMVYLMAEATGSGT